MHIQPTPFFGQMLVLAILAVTCLRVYFISKTRIDSLVLFAPLAFFITILQIFANGLAVASWLVLCLSFIVFFINWRGVIRFCNHLFVDTYSIAFLISSSICLVLTILLAVVLILNIPVTHIFLLMVYLSSSLASSLPSELVIYTPLLISPLGLVPKL